MKFLQKRQNEKSFTRSDYIVLSYEQLLQVNGAGGSSSGGGGPSGPSGNLTDRGYPSSTDLNTGNSSSSSSEKVIYGAPTDSKRVTGIIGEKTTHQDAHTGIDIGALKQGEKGDPLYAVADGTITRNGTTNSGSTIVIQTLPGTNDTAVYQHGDFTVEVGTVVQQGDQIGTMADNGTPGNVHLHFEIRQDGLYAGDGGTGNLVNPLDYLPSTYSVQNN